MKFEDVKGGSTFSQLSSFSQSPYKWQHFGSESTSSSPIQSGTHVFYRTESFGNRNKLENYTNTAMPGVKIRNFVIAAKHTPISFNHFPKIIMKLQTANFKQMQMKLLRKNMKARKEMKYAYHYRKQGGKKYNLMKTWNTYRIQKMQTIFIMFVFCVNSKKIQEERKKFTQVAPIHIDQVRGHGWF